MKVYWVSRGTAPRILDLGPLDGGYWSASRPRRFIPRKRVPATHWIGGWVGPTAGLDAVVKRKFPAPAGSRTPVHLSRSLPSTLGRTSGISTGIFQPIYKTN
jgi:hypothetical protein